VIRDGNREIPLAPHDLQLERDGARHVPNALAALDVDRLRTAADAALDTGPGRRVARCDPAVRLLLAEDGAIERLASMHLGERAKPVRLVFFDKTEANNWAVAWHQDRTIAVKARCEVGGFGPWSIKGGVLHVSPPFAVLEQMVTVRVHLDDCSIDNAPLRVALGSHKLGSVKAQEAASVARALPVVACLARAGDAWLYRTPILHASDPAIKPRRRRVIQVDYAAFDLPHGLARAGL
jgi:hypothetical protein